MSPQRFITKALNLNQSPQLWKAQRILLLDQKEATENGSNEETELKHLVDEKLQCL